MAFASPVWLAAGLRTPFVKVDGPFAHLDSLGLSVPVVKAMSAAARGPIDLAIWGSVGLNLAYANLGREVWLEAGLDPHVPASTTVMQCSTSMMAAFQAAGMLGEGRHLALVGGVESMSRIQIGLRQGLSVGIRRVAQGKGFGTKLKALASLRPRDFKLFVPAIKNRVTGKSMGEHCEEMAKAWAIAREAQDALALESHQRAVAGQAAGFFEDLLLELEGVKKDAFPRKETSMEKLASLAPVFDRAAGTLTAGNSSPLTDGAAGLWVASEEGLARLPEGAPRVRLVDFESGAVDIFHEGLLMAPAKLIPRLLARHQLAYGDIQLWEIHEAFSAQVLCHLKALEDPAYVQEQAGVAYTFGVFPRERMNPHGGSVALGHPFAATGARILSQAVKELAALPPGSRAIVSICSDGGLGTVALLEH
jgi:acetyl-CoA C-acetyltransferase